MNVPTTYLLNVALHGAVLSVFASGILLVMRQARYRSAVAIGGLLAVGLLPWLSALRPAGMATAPTPEIQTQSPALPTWTVVTLPVRQEESMPASQPAPASAGSVFPDTATTLVSLWAVGTVGGLVLLGTALLKVCLWRKSLLSPDEAALQLLRSFPVDVPSRSCFLLSETDASPCVTGFFKTRIVLPRFLLTSASDEELRWAVLHETAHWRAGDSRWMVLFSFIHCLNWWNPLVHQFVSAWADAREKLCDLHATGVSENRADYGRFLVAMAGVNDRRRFTVAMAGRSKGRQLRSRIVSLLDAEPGAGKAVGKHFVGLGFGVALGLVALVSCVKVGSGDSGWLAGASAGAILTDSKAPLPEGPYVLPNKANLDGPLLIRISTRFMVTSPDTNFGGGSCSDKGVETIMKEFEKIGKATFATVPELTTKPGQATSFKSFHEIHEPVRGATRTAQSPTSFVGADLSSVATVSHRYVVDLHQVLDYRYVPGAWRFGGSEKDLPAGLTPGKIKILKRTLDFSVLSGNTWVTLLGEIEPGKYLTLLTKAEIMDPTGRSIKFPE